ncbi:ATP-dependent sacrificial sulfur transferase LarE [Clostridium sp. AM58-1XD]|uniref:ATP-dependent sacrificial sulfur transferase LarE n=1 Tax=Clostridium sp. AM58-1XD TaxID=2292307 RepID=UPI000E54C7F5|nr:ATP-dependent sacrificial sulfur transferase LarE [Clostridium sp. AM58-1XD]RGZ01929.1 ATP-dependent sacrificial sulfur transferase LarE [Clostridium sp. AM58-1XD]
MEFAEKKKKLSEMMDHFAEQGICLAFSGGVDSSLLLKMACSSGEKLGKCVYAVTFATRLHPSCDMENAGKVAAELGGVHVVLQIDELEQEEIRKNPPDRCYLCKKRLFSELKSFAEEKRAGVCLDGTNSDDLAEYRPGLRALRELSVVSPLAECGFSKEEVRRLAAEYGISSAGRPSAPCMATRLPYGAEIDYDLLDNIAAGEELLREYVRGNVRLRLHGDIVRLEIDQEQFATFLEKREMIVKALKNLGFCYVTLDMEGFRSGSMDIHVREAGRLNLPDSMGHEKGIDKTMHV